jgi:N-acetyl-gamma-glutamyl-phosphate reductase
MSVHAVVLGASGYVGGELLRLIGGHPHIRLAAAVSGSRAGDRVAAVFPHLEPLYPNVTFTARDRWADVLEPDSKLALFSAAPHGASAGAVAAALERAAEQNLDVRVVDSSADFRYADADAYRQVYGVLHGAPQLLPEFHCAVPEHARGTDTSRIGHPGCFATAVLLAGVPLVTSGWIDDELFACGTTGSTGAGREPQAGTHHPERHANLYAYKPLSHRHAPEMERLLSDAGGCPVAVNFVPHSGPFARGIYVTLQARLTSEVTEGDLRQAFCDYYRESGFVRIVDGAPKLKDVVASNYCHIGLTAANGRVVVMAAIDNLLKGAAGGAIQWMNRLWSLPESTGLLAPAPAWT